jgi:hypothetical protein
MILYTMIPQELIFQQETAAPAKQIMATFDGVPLLVDMTDLQNVQVVRVLSSDPQHYMDERFYPGSKISFGNLEGLSLV